MSSRGRVRVRGLRRCERGAAAVEFALVVPALLMIFLAIGVYGTYLGAAHSLRQIANEAARASVAGVSDAERTALATQRVNAALAAGTLFRPGSLSVAVGPDPADAALYAVTLTFDAQTLGLAGFARLLPMPPNLLTSTVSVRRGGL